MAIERIPLSEMLAELRKELLDAQSKGRDSDLKFQIDDIELELQVVTTEGGEAGAGVKFWVYNANAEVKTSEASTQKLKLKMKPMSAASKGEIQVSDETEKSNK